MGVRNGSYNTHGRRVKITEQQRRPGVFREISEGGLDGNDV